MLLKTLITKIYNPDQAIIKRGAKLHLISQNWFSFPSQPHGYKYTS